MKKRPGLTPLYFRLPEPWAFLKGWVVRPRLQAYLETMKVGLVVMVLLWTMGGVAAQESTESPHFQLTDGGKESLRNLVIHSL